MPKQRLLHRHTEAAAVAVVVASAVVAGAGVAAGVAPLPLGRLRSKAIRAAVKVLAASCVLPAHGNLHFGKLSSPLTGRPGTQPRPMIFDFVFAPVCKVQNIPCTILQTPLLPMSSAIWLFVRSLIVCPLSMRPVRAPFSLSRTDADDPAVASHSVTAVDASLVLDDSKAYSETTGLWRRDVL